MELATVTGTLSASHPCHILLPSFPCRPPSNIEPSSSNPPVFFHHTPVEKDCTYPEPARLLPVTVAPHSCIHKSSIPVPLLLHPWTPSLLSSLLMRPTQPRPRVSGPPSPRPLILITSPKRNRASEVLWQHHVNTISASSTRVHEALPGATSKPSRRPSRLIEISHPYSVRNVLDDNLLFSRVDHPSRTQDSKTCTNPRLRVSSSSPLN